VYLASDRPAPSVDIESLENVTLDIVASLELPLEANPPATKPAVGVSGVTLLLALLDVETPLTLTVATVKVYEVPLDRPVTIIGLDEPVPVILLGE
jgi:hypothetical protein